MISSLTTGVTLECYAMDYYSYLCSASSNYCTYWWYAYTDKSPLHRLASGVLALSSTRAMHAFPAVRRKCIRTVQMCHFR